NRGEPWSIECRPFPPGGAASPVVTLHDARGALLAQARCVDTPGGTARIEWRAPEDGGYQLRPRDMQQGIRGGPELVYRLTPRPTEPEFDLALATDFVNVVPGGRAEAEVLVERTGGFSGPVDVSVEGLPEGVRAETNPIASGQGRRVIALIADPGAQPGDATLRVLGTARIGDRPREHPARVPCCGLDDD